MATEHHSDVGSLWIGGKLPPLARLCLGSFIEKGHRFTLYSYDDVPNAPAGVDLADADPIFSRTEFAPIFEARQFARVADFFRYRMVEQTGKLWVDTDVLCLKPFPRQAYHIGLEVPQRVGNAIYYAPQGSDLSRALLWATRGLEATLRGEPIPLRMAGRGPEWAAVRKAQQGVPQPVTDFPYAAFGPHLLTGLCRSLELAGDLQPIEVYNAIKMDDLKRNALRPWNAPITLPEIGICAHLNATWLRNIFRRNNISRLRPRSFLGREAKRLGVDPDWSEWVRG